MGREIVKTCSRKRKLGDELSINKVEGNSIDIVNEHSGIPMVPSDQNTRPRVIFVLDQASLTLAHVGKDYQILNQEKHADFLRKKKKDPYKYRPEIVHNALLGIMYSRINMAGLVQFVLIKTDEGLLIKVDPRTRIPDSLEEFCVMMSQLLQKLRIKAKGKREELLRLVKNPITQYLPVNSFKIGLSFNSTKVVELRDYFRTLSYDINLVFWVGAMAHGKIDSQSVDELISVSGFHLSARVCLRMIYEELARKYGIW